MNRFILWLMLVFPLVASAQSPIVRNDATTNAPAQIAVSLPTLSDTLSPIAHKSGTNRVFQSAAFTMTGTNTSFLGWLALNAQTNQISDSGTQLLYNGVPIGGSGITNATGTNNTLTKWTGTNSIGSVANGTGILTNDGAGGFGWSTDIGSESNPINNFYSTNNFFISGKGNTLVITQTLTVSGQYVYPLVPGTGITFATNNIGTGQTNLTISATATGGDTTATNIVTLTMTTTNVSAMDFSLVQRGGVFKLVLTGNGYIGAPTGIANTSFSHAFLMVQQPSTGTCVLTFTNLYCFSEGVMPVLDTNNGSVSVIELVSDVFTNGLIHGSISTPSKRIP